MKASTRARLQSYSLPYSNDDRVPVNRDKLGPFVDGYIECALWSTTDLFDLSDKSLEQLGHSKHSIEEPTLLQMIRDCLYFNLRNHELLDEAYEDGYKQSQAGHDFWLSRNGHGAGFFDHAGWGDDTIWDKLQHSASHEFREFPLWVDENDEVAGDISEIVQKMNGGRV